MTPPVVVVAVALLRGRALLAARRSFPPELAGGWELPGGKVEPGERDEDALVRECAEELGVEVRLGRRVGADWPLGPGRVLRVWTGTLGAGEPQPLQDHDLLRWLPAGSWHQVEWLPADAPIVAALEALVLQEPGDEPGDEPARRRRDGLEGHT
ncbi:(deoxy)nucleoside triphosphate pyrophosphohydrolase [Motilibacter aurantiacus]|uniref:(deoxy)nucleoside triphosphate pyrophosphohydrolase n=1 Tax=Motilibacter aurantiacus TaxID=2714955 RepID=UPI00140E137C|nr:NUDIX domain-containing protein [Motilibacter aurantiacus]NHC45764.1 NUDIX domain-containing protein [Motilibacter aurantiacus]